MSRSDKIVEWIRAKVREAGAKGCVFGLSGGLDSSVVGVLCKKAFPDNVLGLILPCYSVAEDLKDAQALAGKNMVPTKLIDLEPVLNQLFLQFEGKAYDGKEMSLAVANLKPRLRMVALYYHANKNNYLVVGTGNRSEAAMGYCTKHGDGGVDLLPLGNLLKTEVRELARELGIPEKIIQKVPTAGLWPGQTDEGEMGISYAELDKIVLGLEKNNLSGLDLKLVEKVKNRMQKTRHKFEPPPSF